MELALLVGRVAVAVQVVHALIAGVSQKFKGRRQRETTAFEEGKIMNFAGTGCHAENGLPAVVNHDLPLLGMAFLLAGVEPE